MLSWVYEGEGKREEEAATLFEMNAIARNAFLKKLYLSKRKSFIRIY